MKRWISLGLLVALGTSFAACSSDSAKPAAKSDAGGGGGGGGGGGAGGAANNDPTWSNVWKKVIVANNCFAPECHGAGQGGGLRMDGSTVAYNNLVSQAAMGGCRDAGTDAKAICGCATSGKLRVSPGKPDESLIIEKISGSPTCGDPMPPTGDPISPDLVDLVRKWIAAGAPKN